MGNLSQLRKRISIDGGKKLYDNYNPKPILININDYFDHIYCLNLDRRIDKWEIIKNKFEILNINAHRFSAVDGNQLPLDVLSKQPKLNKHEIGCKLSHIDIINEIKNDKTFLINSNHNDIKNVYTKDIFEWIDIITSCEKFICQYSGASVVMACYNKPCVIYKNTLDETYKFKIHKYINI